MATASKSGALSYYAASPEEEEAIRKYRTAQNALQEALASRQQLFDPVLLAMAQGFLAPTKTGSFGESLANVAAQVGPVQSAEEKRTREIAQMKAELAAQELGMTQQTRRQRRAEELSREFMGQAPAGAPAPGGAAPGAAPAAAPGAAPTAAAPAVGATAAAPRGLRPLMESDIAAMYEVDPERANMYEKLMRSQRGQFTLGPKGQVFNTVTGRYTGDTIPEEAVPYPIPGGTMPMLPSYYTQYQEAARQGLGAQWIEAYRSRGAPKPISDLIAEARTRPGAAGVAEGPRAPGAPGARVMTAEEAKAEEGAQRILAEERAKGMAKRTEEALNAGEGFAGRMATYNSIDKIAARRDADKIFGILNRPGVAQAIITLASDQAKLPGGGNTISVPGLESALRNVGLPQELINQYQFALSQIANLQLMQSRITEGQGAVSDRERVLFASASISDRDNPATIRAKVAMYKARAELDRDIANELRKSGMTIDQFKTERKDWYDNQVNRYLDRVESIVDKLGVPPGAPFKRGSAAGAPSTAAGQALRKELGIQ